MVPMPRGAISKPGGLHRIVRRGSADRAPAAPAVASSSMPTANIITRPAEKFPSLKMRGGMNGLSAVSMWTTNR